MAKKKKMTKAQAAAARRDDRPKRVSPVAPVKDEGPKSKDTRLFQMIIPIVAIAVIILFSVAFTVLPGMIMNK